MILKGLISPFSLTMPFSIPYGDTKYEINREFRQLTCRDEPTASATNTALLAWYDCHARRFAWRTLPGAGGPGPDPYRVWLAEIMLQQTGVERAEPYFIRFTDTWPEVRDLANARREDVLAAWAGLGYYARARNLHACARIVADSGFPRTPKDLQDLPGIGPYTAAAIAAIAFGYPVAAVDANVRRVIARLTARKRTSGLPAWEKRIQASADTHLDTERPGDWAQAMMDLGAVLCRPREPKCGLCPVAEHCKSLALGVTDKVPGKALKPRRERRAGAAFYLADGGQVLVVRRPDRGLLGGMLAVPGTEWTSCGEYDLSMAPAPRSPWRKVGCVHHSFTHFDLSVDVWRADLTGHRPDGIWIDRRGIHRAGMASLFQKVVRMAEAATGNSG